MGKRAVITTDFAVLIEMFSKAEVSQFKCRAFELTEVFDGFDIFTDFAQIDSIETRIIIIQMKYNILTFNIAVHDSALVHIIECIHSMQRYPTYHSFDESTHFVVFEGALGSYFNCSRNVASVAEFEEDELMCFILSLIE